MGAGLNKHAIVTTNFRPFEAVISHMVSQVQPDVPVIWMDNGYYTPATFQFADAVTKQLGLNLQIYLPLAVAPTAKPWKAQRPRWMTHAMQLSRKR